MKRRKRIALVTTNPESIYQTRVIDGVLDQCAKYGYDVAVFSTLVHLSHYYKDYLNGEVNIYNLINFDLFDGIIITSISFSDNNTMPIFNEMLERFKRECRKKVVALDLPFGDYEVAYTDDRGAFKEITEHIFDVHKCKNVYFLTGVENYAVSENRLGGYLDFLEERNIPVDKNKIFYGDFWYSSGEELALKICRGEVEMPDAVICGSDHMAIGLANKLIENGIKIPEQIIVTGYDATQEAVMNDVSITSYEPKVSHAAAEAVNIIHREIDPDIPEEPISNFVRSGMRMGESCGCAADVNYMKEKMSSTMIAVHHNLIHDSEKKSRDISQLLDSYLYEQLITADEYKQCLSEIFYATFFIKPFKDFYLCLKEDWLDVSASCKSGYPEKMKIVIHSREKYDKVNPTIPCFTETDKKGERSFETKLMFPEMLEDSDEPSVYSFSPVHFSDETFGYCVLRCGLDQGNRVNYVYRNWVRYVNNALEITRIRTKLLTNSTLDVATGLFNRRGMYVKLDELIRFTNNSDRSDILVIMADMDGLKYINDNFGHNEGDFGLICISEALKRAVGKNEIAVRFAGDEFLIIGINNYTEAGIAEKIERIQRDIEEQSKNSGKPYPISASLGYCCEKLSSDTNIDRIIDIADEQMYLSKRKKHKNRRY